MSIYLVWNHFLFDIVFKFMNPELLTLLRSYGRSTKQDVIHLAKSAFFCLVMCCVDNSHRSLSVDGHSSFPTIWPEFSCQLISNRKAQSSKNKKRHKPLRNPWISQTIVSGMFDNHKILLFWLYNKSLCLICVSCSVHMISTSYAQRIMGFSYLNYHVIGFCDLVDLWVIKIKPMILCARSTSRSSYNRNETQITQREHA